jgi:hypothetical protein
MSDGMHKVRLSESGSSVQKQGIVGIARGFGYGKAGGMREHIVASDDKCIESVLGMKMSVLDLGPERRFHRVRFIGSGTFLFFVENEFHIILFSKKL